MLKGQNFKKELREYLLMYHSTPHSVTGISPAELMLSRKLRDKLPSLKDRIEVPAVRDRDSYSKALSTQRMESSTVLDKDIEVGDEVLIQRPFSKRKSDSKFESETGHVTAVNGPVVSISTPSRDIQRHVNQVEEFQEKSPLAPDLSETPPTSSDPPDLTTIQLPKERPIRTRSSPIWHKDFIM